MKSRSYDGFIVTKGPLLFHVYQNNSTQSSKRIVLFYHNFYKSNQEYLKNITSLYAGENLKDTGMKSARKANKKVFVK